MVLPTGAIIASSVWIANDARSRGVAPLGPVLLMIFLLPIGWLIWLVFRPSKSIYDITLFKQDQRTITSQPQSGYRIERQHE